MNKIIIEPSNFINKNECPITLFNTKEVDGININELEFLINSNLENYDKESNKGKEFQLETIAFRRIIGISTGNIDLTLQILNRYFKNIVLDREHSYVKIMKGNHFSKELAGLYGNNIIGFCPSCDCDRKLEIRFKNNTRISVRCERCSEWKPYKIVKE